MRSFLLHIVLGLSLMFISEKVHASHSVGIDLAYECLGGNNYRFTLNFYRDCVGIDAPGAASIQLYSASCGINAALNLNLQSSREVSPICPSQFSNSTCQGGSLPGIEQYIYASNFTLPMQCNDWVISYTLCCRNSAITNLQGPGNANIYAEVLLDNTNNLCNNSPFFTTLPVPYFCANQTFNYNHGAVDIDGDSLVYTLIAPRTTRTQAIPHAGSFTPTSPLATNGAFGFNTRTGQMTFNARNAQQAVVTVRVDEYRNGVKVGSTIRDLQLVVLPCTNNLPTASGINGTTTFDITVCTGQQVCLDIITADPDAGQTTTLTYGGGLPGATFTTGGGPLQTGQLCWMPTINDLGTHNFSLTVVDDACPVTGINAYTYTVIVQGNPNPPVNVGPDLQICDYECTPLDELNRPAGVTYSWSPVTGLSNPNIPNPSACPDVTTTYTLSALYPDGCSSSDQVEVAVRNPDPVSIFPRNSTICAGSSLQLNASSSAGSTFLWSTGETTPSIIVTPSSSTTVTVISRNQFGCVAHDTAYITYSPPPPAQVCNVIYVTPTGTGSGLTSADPTSLLTGISMAQCNNLTIKMSIGTYNIDNPITLASLLTLEGGFDAANGWTKTSQAGATTILRSALNPEGPASAQRIVAAYVNSAVFFRLQDLTIRTADAPPTTTQDGGISTYALYMSNCSDYDIVRCQLIAGKGGTGGPGAAGPAGARPGDPGQPGEPGDGDAGCCRNGGAGGTSPVGNPGAAGGTGGAEGANGGTSGSNAPGNTAPFGQGGTAGAGVNGCGLNCDAGAANTGGNGAPGTPGTTPPQAAVGPAGTFSAGFFAPGSTGATGAAGGPGSGGGGGGGGGGQGGCICLPLLPCNNGAGPGGGGGGGGGEGGIGGGGGYGGGGSFGIYLRSNGNNGNFIDCFADGVAGDGGPGGLGGPGGAGGAGGNGGNLNYSNDCDIGIGGNGGNGGDGGQGGQGGNGNVGVGYALYLDGGQPLVSSDTNFNLSSQPIINAANVSCTNRPVAMSTAVSDNWSFGNGATPLFANAASATPSYSNTGRKNITYSGEGYTGFVNIAIDSSAYKPNISSTATMLSPDTYFLCSGEQASFLSDAIGSDYDWNFGGAVSPNTYNTQNVMGLTFTTTGTFIITMRLQTDCCGWSGPDSVTLVVEPSSPVTLAGDTILCVGESTNITLSGASSYSVTPNIGALNGPVATITLNPTVTTTYLVLGFSPSGNCTTSVNLTVHVYDIPVVTTSVVDATCTAGGTATANVTGGSGTYNYAWDDPASQNVQTAINLATGGYTVTVTDAVAGCTNTAFAFVSTTGPVAFISNTTPVSCYGGNDGSATAAGTGGSGNYTFTWPGGFSGTTDTALAAGEYTVTLTDNITGCIATATAFIPQPDSMVVVTALLDSAECANSGNAGRAVGIADGGNGEYNYQWFSDSLLTVPIIGAADDTIQDLPGGTFYVVATDYKGCTALNSVVVLSLGLPFVLDSSVTNPSCPGREDGVISLVVSGGAGGYSYTWNPSTVSNTGANNLGAGDYFVTVTDAEGCDTPMVFSLVDPDGGIVAITPQDTTIKPGTSIQLTSVYQSTNPPGTLSYFWTPPLTLNCDTCPNPMATPEVTTTYTLIVIDQNNCPVQDTTRVIVELDDVLWVPNAFTPNGDDENDIFYAYGRNIRTIRMIVADRWGEKVFESNDLSIGWDGTYKGKRLNPDVFVFYVEATFFSGKTASDKGSVTLIR